MKSIVITALLSAGLLVACSGSTTVVEEPEEPKAVATFCHSDGSYIDYGDTETYLYYRYVLYDDGSIEPLEKRVGFGGDDEWMNCQELEVPVPKPWGN